MQQIADWLEKLGVGQYTQRFAENEIDFSVLRHLTDQDLGKSAFHSGIGGRFSRQSVKISGSSTPTDALQPVEHLSRRAKTPPSAGKSR